MKYNRSVLVENKLGLHARAATKLATLANTFSADITIQQEDKTAPANSVMGLMMLESYQGKTITVCCDGEDAEAALDAVCKLFADKFDEGE